MRYDVCIIGAGAEGLTAAAVLARAGRKVAVLERSVAAGGRCVTQEFSPGFFASPYADELPAIPPDIFRELDLARRGAILMPPPDESRPLVRVREAVIAHVLADSKRKARWLRRAAPPWPGEDLVTRSSVVCGGEGYGDPEGGALALLAAKSGGLPCGGLGALGSALRRAAQEAGADIQLGCEVTDIRCRHGRIAAVGVADRPDIDARAVISTLDLKRTFLSLFSWNTLPKALVERVGSFRAAPGVARLLLALDAPPDVTKADRGLFRRPIALPGSGALRAWAEGLIPDELPVTLRLVTAVDPSLAPVGGAVLTATASAIAHTLFDGPWDAQKREFLQARILARIDEIFPGTSSKVNAAKLLVPPDIESELGLTAGDLYGGALSPSQMLSFRPFCDCAGTRTPIAGLYLAGPSSALGPLATCASGYAAAHAVLTDLGGLR